MHITYGLAVTAVLGGLAAAAGSAGAQTQTQSAAERAAQGQARTAASPHYSDTSNVVVKLNGDAAKMRVAADELYRGFRADRLMGQDVMGPNGNKLGDVSDIIIGRDGKISAIVVEGGGFLSMGEAAFRVAWKDVDTTPGKEGIKVPITEQSAERYDLFDGPDWAATGPREFRVSEILGDYARLQSGTGYGYVSDAMFGRDGKLLGVVVSRSARYGAGMYGYPYYGYSYGWSPGLAYYPLPYANAETAGTMDRLDLRRFDESEKQIF